MLWFYDFSNHARHFKEIKKNKSHILKCSFLLTTGDTDIQIDCKKYLITNLNGLKEKI